MLEHRLGEGVPWITKQGDEACAVTSSKRTRPTKKETMYETGT
jgi:hypothetical protein